MRFGGPNLTRFSMKKKSHVTFLATRGARRLNIFRFYVKPNQVEKKLLDLKTAIFSDENVLQTGIFLTNEHLARFSKQKKFGET